MFEEWEDYKQRMDEVLLSRGESKTELGSTLTKDMTKEEVFEALKSLQEKVRMGTGYYENILKQTEEYLESLTDEEFLEAHDKCYVSGKHGPLVEDFIKSFDYEKDDGELSDEVIETIKSESSATDTSEDKFDQKLF